jgi:PKD repeat protein
MAGLGAEFNVISEASGLDIPLSGAGAVSFVSFLDAGTHTLTLTQTDSTGVNSEIDLDEADNVYSHIGPGVGGTWTAVTQTADQNVVDGATATNDCYVITVRASQLAAGYDRVQCTASAGTCVAIIHDLHVMRKPSNLKSSLVA